ncbi:fumarate reductase/succinate dehydrogenase flavoprotein domain protein [Denitrovibrio acetiphilus DSM 12809]|uniref:Fumarate reductase/succinate dehydrogenase flavoprotein domain protein n=1 Tax=Denitrovibrio acetiphilus (strain DSM 12809 / NBRC 114555 / N2460) TaxID=522772 RepID=D4H526_DENA2|nr:FAD-dependent oxidoreductase [Denitrovibrio acetiphilus]ADD69382.1 fumarate reductase/succinate dehydrogenase flavoprotein domain protein [Denitrovibrio acetiphilus DSM 12809]
MRSLSSNKFFVFIILAVFSAFPAFAEKVYNTDFAIVGGGTTGLAAGVQAKMLGADVIILEKQPITGGTGNFAEGIFAAESSLQLRQGIDVSKEFAFKTIMDYSHWRANGPLVSAFVNKSAETIEWLKQFGIQYEYIGVGGFGGPLTWHVIGDYEQDGKHYHHGKAVMMALTKRFQELGGTLLLETPGVDLIKKDGKIAGVIGQDKSGEKIRINAKAVLVATGGFANNREMVAKYSRYPDMIFIGHIGKTGDGIQMAWKAGADEEGVDVMQSYRPGLKGFHPASHLIAAAVQPYLFVDPNGHRYTDESNITEWPQSGNALERIGGTAYSIYDENTKQMVINEGIQMPLGEWVIHGTKLDNLEKDFNKELKKNNGNVYKCDTIEEVAKAIGADPAVLKATVEANNVAAEKHKDDLFHKDAKYLRKIEKAPFYVTKLHPRALGTLGGIRINEHTEVVDADGETIPGLYSGGLDAGGMYGDSYDLKLGGGTFGFAINSGRIAAESAVKYILK